MIERHPKPRIVASIPLDRHAVIEASAGTGKTYTLEHLVVELLLSTELELESILVVTYTERAAGELRSRLRKKLRELAGPAPGSGAGAAGGEFSFPIDDAARAKLLRSLTNFDLASISTIHAFCQQVLMENAFASHRLFEQELVDGRVAFSRAFMSSLRRSIARDPLCKNYLDAWLEHESLDELSALLYECHHKRGEFSPPWSEDQFTRAIAGFVKAAPNLGMLELQLKRLRLAGNTAGAIITRWKDLLGLLEEYSQKKSVPHLLAGLAAQEKRNGGFFDFIYERLADRTGSMDPLVRPAFEALFALRAAFAPLASAAVESFLPLVRAELERDKARSGQLDFDDMLVMLWESLQGTQGEALARSVRARWRAALVDEFQDTDDVQWRIFSRLFVERARGPGRDRLASAGRSALPSGDPMTVLYVIGDPKQAIYGFRGADVHTYLQAGEELLGRGGAKLTLTENHRSSPKLIEALNFILDQSADPPFFEGAIRYDHPVTAARAPADTDLPGPPVRLLRVVSGGDGPLTAALAKPAIASSFTAEIAALLEAGVDPGEIFILARSARECTDIGAHLRAAGIPLAFYKQEGLFQTQEAADIRDLLTAIADPARQSRRFRAWIGPFFAVPLESLPACIDLPATHPLLAYLFEWRVLADSKDYNRLFTRILEDSGIIERELFFEESERELTNYLHIFEILLEEASRARPNLEELIHTLSAFIENRRLPEGENGNVQRLESEKAAVQIMTMHKAKGLEARVVFLFGGLDPGKLSRVHIYHDAHTRRISVARGSSEAIERERDEEDRRLLYVALTRAKERIYLPYFAPSGERTAGGKTKREIRALDGLYRHLNEALDRAAARVARAGASGEAGDELFSLTTISADAVERERISRASREAIAAWVPPAELLEEPARIPELEAIRASRSGLVITSYTRMKAAAGGYQPPENPAAEEEAAGIDAGLGADAPGGPAVAVVRRPNDLPGGTASGRFLHEVLEKIPFETIADSAELAFWAQRGDVKEVFAAAMKNHDRAPQYLRHSQELIWTALTAPIRLGSKSLPRGVAGAKQIVREMEFLYPVAHPSLVKGFIDLVFEHEGRIYLLDWKSDLLPSYAADELEVHAKANYSLQAELYALALVKMLQLRTRETYEEQFGGILYCFVRGMTEERWSKGVLFSRPSWREISASAERLARGEAAVSDSEEVEP